MVGIRFGETIKAYQADETLNTADLKLIPLVFAGWLRYLMGVDDEGNTFELSPDPLLETVCPYVADIRLGEAFDAKEVLKDVLGKKEIWGVCLYCVAMADLVCQYFTELCAGVGAIRKTLKKYVGE